MTSNNKDSLVDTTVLDGLRIFFNCAIVCYHAYLWKNEFLTNMDPSFQAFANNNPIAILSNQGTSWVDIFFILNSCLLVYNLLPRLENGKSSDSKNGLLVWKIILDFYCKKFYSIVPIYIASTLSIWLFSTLIRSSFGSTLYVQHIDLVNGFTGNCPDRIWKNVFLMNNWGPDIGCGGTNWTLAPTLQCYILTPLLLMVCRPRSDGFKNVFFYLLLLCFALVSLSILISR